MVLGGYWSIYWYKGHIYGTEITRGIDVFKLAPTADMTEAEIAAANAAKYEGGRFNPQTQTRVTWDKAAIDAAEASRKGG
jgi:hypothetical protein